MAARYGLTDRITSPLMVYDLTANPLAPPANQAAAARVAAVGPQDSAEYGAALAAGFGVFLEGTCGLYNIATAPGYRSRGYGRAVSSRIMADGIGRGAELAYLQSTPDGYPLYQSMGFRTVETWTYLCSPVPGG